MYESKYNNDLQEAFEAGYRKALNEQISDIAVDSKSKGGTTMRADPSDDFVWKDGSWWYNGEKIYYANDGVWYLLDDYPAGMGPYIA